MKAKQVNSHQLHNLTFSSVKYTFLTHVLVEANRFCSAPEVFSYCSFWCCFDSYFVVISSPKGPAPNSEYEHSSIPATIKKMFNLSSNFLTHRDAWAGTFEQVVGELTSPRTDCPGTSLLTSLPLRNYNPPAKILCIAFWLESI